MSDIERDHREILHDLRVRVLAGEDVSAEEMLLIVESIRRGRRTAGEANRKSKAGSKGKKGAVAPKEPFDLARLLDEEI